MLNITANPSTGVPQGLTLNLICEAVGEPTLNVTWITPTGKRVGPVISVDSVTAGDAGDYTCEVTADDRSASSSITIRGECSYGDSGREGLRGGAGGRKWGAGQRRRGGRGWERGQGRVQGWKCGPGRGIGCEDLFQ